MHRDWVIPDIHGCVKTVKALIETKVKPEPGDTLYFLGDYIDRGPDSKGVIDYLMFLDTQDYNCYFLKGNHEDFCTQVYEEAKSGKSSWLRKSALLSRWKHFGGKETLKSFGVKRMSQFPEKYYNWMKSLTYYLELDNFFLVHAGFDFTKETIFEDTEAMMWTMRFEVVPEKVNHKKVIYGHLPFTLDHIQYCIEKYRYNRIPLDNGVYRKGEAGFGNLLALELNSRTVEVQPNIDQ